MKTLMIILLALVLVTLCVVTLRYATRPTRSAPTPAIALQKPRPRAVMPRIHPPKPRSAQAIEPVDITGPLRNRALVRMVVPPYPEWAEEQGVGGVVSVKIWAKPDGRVSSFLQPVQATPYPKLDAVALAALKQWQFAEIPNAVGDQWGIVTFRFVLETRVPELIPEERSSALLPSAPVKPGLPAY